MEGCDEEGVQDSLKHIMSRTPSFILEGSHAYVIGMVLGTGEFEALKGMCVMCYMSVFILCI